MFVVDEQSDFQKPFEVKRKRVCVCVRETSQTTLGAVCDAVYTGITGTGNRCVRQFQ